MALRKSMEHKDTGWEESVVVALRRLSKMPRSLSAKHYDENPAWEKLHRAFHTTLVGHCGSRWLVSFCKQLYDQAYRYRQLAVKRAYKKRNELAGHRAIVDAIGAADAAAACAALAAHYTCTTRIMLDSAPPS